MKEEIKSQLKPLAARLVKLNVSESDGAAAVPRKHLSIILYAFIKYALSELQR